jgi:hypothetical protein
MSLAELMPAVRSLTRDEKAELKRLLDSELSNQEISSEDATDDQRDRELLRQLAIAAQVDIPRPGESYEAAAILSQFLESEKSKAR